jgi:hypothetical protein
MLALIYVTPTSISEAAVRNVWPVTSSLGRKARGEASVVRLYGIIITTVLTVA